MKKLIIIKKQKYHKKSSPNEKTSQMNSKETKIFSLRKYFSMV